MARDDTLTFALEGELSLGTFSIGVARFERLVSALSRETPSGGEIRWLIDALEVGSAVATIRGVAETDEAQNALAGVIESYVEVGRALESGNTLALAPRVQQVAAEVVNLVNGEVEAIRFETAHADALVGGAEKKASAAALAAGRRPTYGAIRGRVETLQRRGRLRFTLYDTLHDKAVSCYLTESGEDVMRDAWGRMAIVEGWVTRDPASGRPLSVRGVQSVEVLPEAELHGYRRARGAGRKRPDPPEVTIRRSRDAD